VVVYNWRLHLGWVDLSRTCFEPLIRRTRMGAVSAQTSP